MNARLPHVLETVRRELVRIYGERLKGVYLFGSRARGDGDEESDVDLAVILEGEVASERERVSEFTSNLSLEHDIVISCVFLSLERYERGEGPLVRNIRAEGVPV